jgi:hypothetical protein
MSHNPTEVEVRWRASYRYRRMRAVWLEEEAMGDPLGFAAETRNSGVMAKLAAAILATGPRQPANRSSRPLQSEPPN